MTLNEYQELAMRTKNPKIRDYLLEALMGLNGEAGEAIEIAKKNMFQGHDLDREKLAEEIGDALWYLAEAADALGIPLDVIAQGNLRKLCIRYPDGYSDERSVNRDVFGDEHDPVYRLKCAVMAELHDDARNLQAI